MECHVYNVYDMHVYVHEYMYVYMYIYVHTSIVARSLLQIYMDMYLLYACSVSACHFLCCNITVAHSSQSMQHYLSY